MMICVKGQNQRILEEVKDTCIEYFNAFLNEVNRYHERQCYCRLRSGILWGNL